MSRVLATAMSNTTSTGTVKLQTSDGRSGYGKTVHKIKKGDSVVARVELPYPRRTYYFMEIEKITP